MRMMKGVFDRLKAWRGKAAVTLAYKVLQTQACSDLKVTALHYIMMELSHDLDFRFEAD